MKRFAVPLLLVISGCNHPQTAAPPATTEDLLTNRVWMASPQNPDLPGEELIFLSNGTLVQDSCWETYSLSSWNRVSSNELTWDEDTFVIQANIQTLTASKLVLKLSSSGDEHIETFEPAKVPYLCQDMPR